jgi:hypothetical protein
MLRNWTAALAAADIIWGMVMTAVVSTLGMLFGPARASLPFLIGISARVLLRPEFWQSFQERLKRLTLDDVNTRATLSSSAPAPTASMFSAPNCPAA